MEFEMNPHIVYVKNNSNGHIVAVNSSAFVTDTADWLEIDSGYGDRYHHAQGNYFPKPIYTDGGAYRYKLVDGKPVECTAEEIKAQEEVRKPKTIAPHNITEGEYITVGDTLYKATANIPNGTPIVTGQNAVVTTVEEQLYELTRGE